MRITLSVLIALTIAGIAPEEVFAQEQEGPPVIFVVIPRDKDSRAVIPDANVWLGWDKGNGVTYSMRDSADGAVLIGLAHGTYDIRVSAPGHESLTIKDVIVDRGTGEFLASCGHSLVSSYGGPTVIIGAVLSRTAPSQSMERIIPWLSESEYYWSTDVPPEPIGGIQGIIEKLDLSKAHPTDNPYYKGYVRAGVYIDQSGNVKRVDFSQDLPEDVKDTIRRAIMNTRFTPAQILGKTVRSHLDIPFDLEIKRAR
jgi:hypothetical protein